MNCTNCGKTNLKNAITCIHCGAEIKNDNFIGQGVHDKANHSDFLSGSRFIENKKMDAENIAFIKKQERKLMNGRNEIISDTIVAEEPITIREREKRIIEERIKKEIDSARELRRISDLEAHDLARADRERRKQERLRAMEIEAIGPAKVYKADEGAIEIPVSEIKVVKRKKKSKARRMLSKFLFYFGGITLFLFLMGFLFWRFAPANEIYKTEFVEWMKLNSNVKVNNFLFNTLGLNDFYTPPRVIDFTGLYVNKEGNGELIDIVYKGMKLTGSYTIGEKQFSLNGFADNKGEFLLMETLGGNPSAIIKGTIFSTGYLAAERFEQSTGHKHIISLQKN